MKITVHAPGLTEPPDRRDVALADGASVADVLQNLAIRSRGAGIIILVNRKLADWNTRLRDGDALELLPAIGGG